MVSFIQFLDELNQCEQTAILSADEVRRLAVRFGPKINNIGLWNKAGDGSVEIPMRNIAEAAGLLDNHVLAQAVEQSSAAGQLIDALSQIYLQQFQRDVERFQDSSDTAEVDGLRDRISRDLFGA